MKWFAGKKVVVPIDFGEESQTALDAALDIASEPNCIHVVYVAPNLADRAPEAVWNTLSNDIVIKNAQDTFRKTFHDDKYRALSFHVLFGDAGHQIVEFAESVDAGLIVMSSHGAGGLKQFLIGSVAERVLRLAHCPVLVLRK